MWVAYTLRYFTNTESDSSGFLTYMTPAPPDAGPGYDVPSVPSCQQGPAELPTIFQTKKNLSN